MSRESDSKHCIVSIVGDSLSLPLRRKLTFSAPLIDSRDMIVSFEDTYPALMQLHLGQRVKMPCLISNDSDRGATTDRLNSRLSAALRDYQPHFLILNIGTSDARFRRRGLRTSGGSLWQKVSLGEFTENLHASSATIVTSRAHLITLAILPAGTEVLKKYPSSNAQFESYNRILESWTRGLGGSFISFAELTGHIDSYVAPDGFHYNKSMHQIVVSRVAEVIEGHTYNHV